MDLYKEILIDILRYETVRIEFPHIKQTAAEIVDSVSYRALQKIKAIIEDDSLEDKECFAKIKKIVQLFDSMGIDSGTRHDFG